MSAHTEGSWSVESIEYGDKVTDDLCIIGPSPDFRTLASVARCYQGDRIKEMEQANARLMAAAPDLLAALEAYKVAQAMSVYGDASDFDWPTITMREPGNSAWGYICEKHGLGYQGGCICCKDEFQRHQDQKNREARYARDDALRASEAVARAVIAKAIGAAA